MPVNVSVNERNIGMCKNLMILALLFLSAEYCYGEAEYRWEVLLQSQHDSGSSDGYEDNKGRTKKYNDNNFGGLVLVKPFEKIPIHLGVGGFHNSYYEMTFLFVLDIAPVIPIGRLPILRGIPFVRNLHFVPAIRLGVFSGYDDTQLDAASWQEAAFISGEIRYVPDNGRWDFGLKVIRYPFDLSREANVETVAITGKFRF